MKKSALLTCTLMLVIGFTLFVGTTYAWWSEAIVVNDNIISMGNLDVIFEAADDIHFNEGYVDLENPDSKILYMNNLAPGQTVTRYLRVTNGGTIDLAYRFSSLGVSSNKDFNNYVTYSIEKIESPNKQISKKLNFLVTDFYELKSGNVDIYKVEVTILETMDCSMQNQYFIFTFGLEAKQVLEVQNANVILWPDLD